MKIYQKLRILFYKLLSRPITLKGKIYQPLLAQGKGHISIGESSFGTKNSPHYLSGYTYLEARSKDSIIIIGNQTQINNNAILIADKTSITIGNYVLIGTEFCAYDSDFHSVDPSKRLSNEHLCLPIRIEDNVFIGSKVSILKGVTIGKNSVIAHGAIVTGDVPPYQIWGGIPARHIANIPLINSSTE